MKKLYEYKRTIWTILRTILIIYIRTILRTILIILFGFDI